MFTVVLSVSLASLPSREAWFVHEFVHEFIHEWRKTDGRDTGEGRWDGGGERLTGQESPLRIQAGLNEFSQVFG